ncbi:MAG: hypothetical protein KF690_12510 [Bacteroidetes bacterium]|nr:hypothetical protein [Bacteroidota bacterium]
MLLLADSGSTKTAWRLLEQDQVRWAHETSGINPNVLTFEQIAAQLQQELLPSLDTVLASGDKVTSVVFYGASFSTETYCRQMYDTLFQLLGTQQIAVHHDILGAARAAAQAAPAIVCIMGTGSNSCYYDGQAMVRQIGGHGYLFGDEGGGVDLGKRLLVTLLNGDAGAELVRRFAERYNCSLMTARNAVYAAPKINAALAAYTPFVHSCLDLPEVADLVQQSFQLFLRHTVLRHPEHREVPLRFVGSVAHIFAPQLQLACRSQGLTVASILQKPIEGLITYHSRHETH